MKTLFTAIKGFHATGGRRTRLAAALLATAGIACFAQVQAADARMVSTSGTTGQVTMLDTADGSYVDCFYQPFANSQYPNGRRLERIEMRPPIIYAVNRTAAEDTQQVSFVATLTRVDASGNHTQVEKAPVQQRSATDRNPASFSPVTFNLSGRSEGRYAIVVDMSWRKPSNPNDSEGNAKFIFDYYDQYRLVSGGANVREWYQAGGCIKTFTW